MPGQDSDRPVVAVIGGGIAGLVALHHLARSHSVDVTLHELSASLGGKIRTGWLGDREVLAELGPDGFVTHGSVIPALCETLGITTGLVPAARRPVRLWSRGRLRPLPSGLSMGIPVRPLSLVRSGVLNPIELARAALDLILPRGRLDHDLSVAALVAPRLGRGALDRLVEPLLGGVYAGTATSLGADSVLPGLRPRLRARRSLIRALREGAPPAAPGMATLRGGLGTLVDALASDARRHGARIELESPVTGLRRAGDGYVLLAGERSLGRARAVVVALPAGAAAAILGPLVPPASRLGQVGYAPVAVVSLLYPADAFSRSPAGSGFLVPRADHRLLRACTWTGVKWPHLAREGVVSARCSVGSVADPGPLALGDAELAGRVHQELQAAVGVGRPPRHRVVTRWEQAIPQYGPGHGELVERVERSLPAGIVLAGAAYHGVGLSACARSAGEASARVLAHLDGGRTAASARAGRAGHRRAG